jgi:hypothetical protein
VSILDTPRQRVIAMAAVASPPELRFWRGWWTIFLRENMGPVVGKHGESCGKLDVNIAGKYGTSCFSYALIGWDHGWVASYFIAGSILDNWNLGYPIGCINPQ